MMAKLKAWLKGPVIAVAAMAIYAIALGCFLALMLLVISMEEGGDNLSVETVPLTKAVVLLSQGVGFTTDSLSLSIVPLLLTLLLIALLASLTRRISTNIRSCVTGLITWIALTMLLTRGLSVGLMDATPIIAVKATAVFLLGFAVGAMPNSNFIDMVRHLTRQYVSDGVRHTVKIGFRLAIVIMAIFLAAGVITVLVWVWSGHEAMGKLFDLNGMETGSRILTTIASLAWLPNLCIWAVSWLFGAGFSIGELGTFTLWVGQSRSLPAVPIFGLFPQSVGNDVTRMILISIPVVIGFILGIISMLLKKGFHIVSGSRDDPVSRKTLILEFAYPAGGFCLTSVVVSLASSLLFVIANGSLGSQRLKNVGTDVMRSTQVCARPSAIGLFAAWLIMLVGVALVFGIRWVSSRLASSGHTERTGHADHGKRQQGEAERLRLVGGSSNIIEKTDVPEVPHKSTKKSIKEEHDDQHEPTDTTGTSVSLP